MCEENELESEFKDKNDAYWNNFTVKGTDSKDHIIRVGMYQDDILKDDSP